MRNGIISVKKYDIVIIGAGPAGIAASVYASRKHLKVLTISKDIGGQSAISLNVKNYGGHQFISAEELIKKFNEHQKKFNLEVKLGVQVDSVEKLSGGFKVSSGNNFYSAKSVIISTGREPKKLNIPGESEFLGKGITYCATCDAPFFKDKIVSVVGGGSAAIYAVIQLLSIAKKIFLINNSNKLNGDSYFIKKLQNSKKVIILRDTKIKKITGDMILKNITIKNENGKLDVLPINGLFIEIGSDPVIPNIKIKGHTLERNSKHEIIVNERCETNISGIFAAGDVTNIPEKQVIIAAGQGSVASLSAFRYINK